VFRQPELSCEDRYRFSLTDKDNKAILKRNSKFHEEACEKEEREIVLNVKKKSFYSLYKKHTLVAYNALEITYQREDCDDDSEKRMVVYVGESYTEVIKESYGGAEGAWLTEHESRGN
jgi:hypothetical protein